MRILIVILLLTPLLSWAQTDRQAIFNEERTMDRRYTLYQGQFRLTGNYALDIFKNSYDINGEKSLLSERGISQNRHAFLAQLRFGLIDYLDLQVRANYAIQNYRGEPIYIIAPPQPSLQVYTTTITSGLEDLYIGLNGRLPIPTKKLDIGLSGGIFLPTAQGQPDQPTHSTSSDELGEVINYQYNENWGYGVNTLFYKGHFKFRLADLAISGDYASRLPLGETETVTWTSRLENDGSFSYASEAYMKQVPQSVAVQAMLEYQLFDWVNIHLSGNHWRTMGGWTEESGERLALPEEKQTWLSPGYEVLVSNKLWLRQTAHFPLTGENTFSQFRLSTTLYYNLFIY
jgi:hypothetical protein